MLLLAFVAGACETGAAITWVNETDQEVAIFLGEGDDDFELTVPPLSSEEGGTIKAVWEDLVIVRDEAGRVLLRQEITWDELEAQDFRFVIPEDLD